MSVRSMPQARLRRIARSEMLTRNAVSGLHGAIRFTWLDQDWELKLSPQAVEPIPGRFQVEANWGGARTVLRADAVWIEQLAQTILDEVKLSMLPTPLVLAVLEAALEPACTQLEEATGQRVQVIGAGTQALDLKGMQSIGWSLWASGRQVSGELWLDAQGMQALAELLPSLETDAAPADQWGALPVPVHFCIGWVTLPASTLRDIGLRDVILLDECSLHESNELTLRVGPSAAFRARLMATSIEIIEAVGAIMEDYDDEFGTDDGVLDDIPVKLTFDLGERILALADLQGVAPGYTFELGRDLRHAVTIRANGMVIGEGELVEIEDRIGVAVLRLRPPGQKSASMAQPLVEASSDSARSALALNNRSRHAGLSSHASDLVANGRAIAAVEAYHDDIEEGDQDDEQYDAHSADDDQRNDDEYASEEQDAVNEYGDEEDDEDDMDDEVYEDDEDHEAGDYEAGAQADEDDEDDEADEDDEEEEDDEGADYDDEQNELDDDQEQDDEEGEDYEDDDEDREHEPEEQIEIPPPPTKSRKALEPPPSTGRNTAPQALNGRPINGNAAAAAPRRVPSRHPDDVSEVDDEHERRPPPRRVPAAPAPSRSPAPRPPARSREPIAPIAPTASAKRIRTEVPPPSRVAAPARRAPARDDPVIVANGTAPPRPRKKTER